MLNGSLGSLLKSCLNDYLPRNGNDWEHLLVLAKVTKVKCKIQVYPDFPGGAVVFNNNPDTVNYQRALLGKARQDLERRGCRQK